MKHAERNRGQRVSAEPRLVRRAVESDEFRVDRGLIERVEADEGRRDFRSDPLQRVLHVKAAEALSSVALVDRLTGATRCAGRRNASPTAPSLKVISASTVGRPRESQMRRATSDWMTGSLIAIPPPRGAPCPSP